MCVFGSSGTPPTKQLNKTKMRNIIMKKTTKKIFTTWRLIMMSILVRNNCMGYYKIQKNPNLNQYKDKDNDEDIE